MIRFDFDLNQFELHWFVRNLNLPTQQNITTNDDDENDDIYHDAQSDYTRNDDSNSIIKPIMNSNLNNFLNEMSKLFMDRIETDKPKKIAKELKNYMVLNNIDCSKLFNLIFAYIDNLDIRIMLGFLYQYGIRVEKNEEMAFDIYKASLSSCERNGITNYLLGMYYQYTIKDEYDKAFECYSRWK